MPDPRASADRELDPDSLAWARQDGLVPAIVQHADSLQVLMLGYMDRAALAATLASRRVTFFSRSRRRLWTKGETSGDVLELVGLEADCDSDALLVRARPRGPTCHLGRASCFPRAPESFLPRLDALVALRASERPAGSYTTRLLDAGIHAVAQKVGEEGVEAALAAVAQDDAALLGESADLLFHLLVLLRTRGLSLADAERELRRRHDTGPNPPAHP
jgi:phosphoribosyl-AMP cyclohydrolase / phosphoribosyl-ATP pyrophosphohydrolase